MHTAIYASLSALLMIFLSVNVIKQRRSHKVAFGDGEVDSLRQARAAQSNASEYIPITLILLFLLEYNGGWIWLVHLLGVALLIGRVLHSRGMLYADMKNRVRGMVFTFSILALLATLNLVLMLKSFLG